MDPMDNNIEIVFRCKLCQAEAPSIDAIRLHLNGLHHVTNAPLMIGVGENSCQPFFLDKASKIQVNIIVDEMLPTDPASTTDIEQLPDHIKKNGCLGNIVISSSTRVTNETKQGSSSLKPSLIANELSDEPTVALDRPNDFTRPPVEEMLHKGVKSTRNLLKCTVCNYTHVNHTAMSRHVSTHNDLKTIKCTECEAMFCNKQALGSHQRIHHLGGEHLCDICGFKAQSKFLLFQHRLKCWQSVFKCQQCDFNTDNIVDLNEHTATRHRNRYTCKRCNVKCVFETKEDILSHTEEYHPGKSCYFCDKCNFVGKLPNHLRKHYMMHTDERPSKCPMNGCQFSTRNATYLKYHVAKVHSKDKFICRQCCYVSTDQQQLDLHISVHHMKIYKCQKCDFEGKSTTALRRHCLRKHIDSSEMRFKCTKCEYCTQFRDCINKHLLTHEMNKNRHRCVFCKIVFPSREDLKVHLSGSHADQACKVRFCDECAYSTSRSSNFRVHVSRKHSFIKPFKCSLCNYTAKCTVSMKLHNSRKHSVGNNV